MLKLRQELNSLGEVSETKKQKIFELEPYLNPVFFKVHWQFQVRRTDQVIQADYFPSQFSSLVGRITLPDRILIKTSYKADKEITVTRDDFKFGSSNHQHWSPVFEFNDVTKIETSPGSITVTLELLRSKKDWFIDWPSDQIPGGQDALKIAELVATIDAMQSKVAVTS